MPSPFHVALVVDDLSAARHFYKELLGCAEGRSDTDWVDFDLYGHQLVCHRPPDRAGRANAAEEVTLGQHASVDGHSVPVPHCGVVLQMNEWEVLAERLRSARAEFLIEPHIRFGGEAGEQGTFFIIDPGGNALEFKGFRNLNQLFVA
jgi:extradiol dioxygenase family protein